MFNKNTSISFIVDKNNNLYIDIKKNNKDTTSHLKIAKLISLLETGEIHNQIMMAVNKSLNNDTNAFNEISNIINYNIKTKLENMSSSKVKDTRDPIITPDAVLSVFKASVN